MKFATWQESCGTRESAISYLANKPGSYRLFYQLEWLEATGGVCASTPYMVVIHDTGHGQWQVYHDGEANKFDSIEQAIAFITHKWW